MANHPFKRFAPWVWFHIVRVTVFFTTHHVVSRYKSWRRLGKRSKFDSFR